MLNLDTIHSSWRPLVERALGSIEPDYLTALEKDPDWLPGQANIFNAFSTPLEDSQTLLLGESPYPRAESANGYAFWDANVDGLWSDKGLSRQVNRATSLRNFVKMLLVAEHCLTPDDLSQDAIASLDKNALVDDIDGLFGNMLRHGFVLLNASLVLHNTRRVTQDAKAWRPFLHTLLTELSQAKPGLTLLLFGKIAQAVEAFQLQGYHQLKAEHPYNISFIHNPDVLAFFQPLHLLKNK
jgi:uracil-DNA glycosylase